MYNSLTIRHPFTSLADLKRCVGDRCYGVLQRLADNYRQKMSREEMLLAASIAWEMMQMATDGWSPSFLQFDDRLNCTNTLFCITIEGRPYCVSSDTVDYFIWDCFNIYIDQQGTDVIAQPYFDEGDRHQRHAYDAMSGEVAPLAVCKKAQTTIKPPSNAPPSKSKLDASRATIAEEEQESNRCSFVNELVDEAIMQGDVEKAKVLLTLLDPVCRRRDGEHVNEINRLEYFIFQQNINKIKQLTMGDTFHIAGDYVKGDKVMGNKYVNAKQSDEQSTLRTALEQLMAETTADGKPLFHLQTQWYGVYRIMVDDYGWADNALADFCRRIDALNIDFATPCKVESIKKINQTAPFYKNMSEWEPTGNPTTYNSIFEVARRFRQLMKEAESEV